MKAGFFATDITPAIGMVMPGGYLRAYHTAVHDPLKVRASVFEDEATAIALVGLDTLSLQYPRRFRDAIRQEVQHRCGIPADNILLAASHTHSGGPLAHYLPQDFDDAPELVRELALNYAPIGDPLYHDHVVGQAVTAICEAWRRRQEAVLSVGVGVEDKVAFNRRFRMRNGRVYTHPGKGNPDIIEPAGPTDPQVGVLGAWDAAGNLLGCVVNFTCHCTTFGGATSADYVHYIERVVQGVYGAGAGVVFLNGACGDVTQVDNQSMREPEFGEKWSRLVGTRVGAEAVKVLATAVPGDLRPLGAATRVLRIPRRKPSRERVEQSRRIVEEGLRSGRLDTPFVFAMQVLFQDYLISKEPEAEVEIQALQVGPALFVANPAELFCALGLEIKRRSLFPYTFVVEKANGCVNYVPAPEAFGPDGGGYETILISDALEVEAGRKIVEASVELALQFTPGAVPDHPQVEAPGQPWDYGVLGPDLE